MLVDGLIVTTSGYNLESRERLPNHPSGGTVLSCTIVVGIMVCERTSFLLITFDANYTSCLLSSFPHLRH